MKAKLFFLLIAGFALSMLSCNSDPAAGTPNDDNTAGTYGTGTGSEVPGDSVRVEPPNIPDPEEPDLSKESRFTESELNQITVLKNLIPEKIVADFEEKYLTWIKTWSRPELAIQSSPWRYANSDEYDDLMNYCKNYGKAIWPLLINRVALGSSFVVSLMGDVIYDGNQDFTDEITLSIKVEVGGGWFPSLNSVLVECCKILLADEYDNILKSIQDIPDLE